MARPPARARTTRSPALRIVLTAVPPRGAAALARALVTGGTAACVNVVRGVRSVYRWQGRLHDDAEALLIVKTTRGTLPRCLAALAAAHPYDVPEVVVLTPGAVGAAYDAWARAATRP